MAGHLPISLDSDKVLTDKVNEILKKIGIFRINRLANFGTIKGLGVHIQKLTPDYAMEDNTGLIFCIKNWHYRKGKEDEFEGCSIEVHLNPDNTIKQLYFVA